MPPASRAQLPSRRSRDPRRCDWAAYSSQGNLFGCRLDYRPARTKRILQRTFNLEKLAITQDLTEEIVEFLRMQSLRTSFSQARRSSGVTSFGNSSASATVANGKPIIRAEKKTLLAITTPKHSNTTLTNIIAWIGSGIRSILTRLDLNILSGRRRNQLLKALRNFQPVNKTRTVVRSVNV